MKEYSGVAGELGIKRREIEAVQSIVMAVAGGRVRAQFCEARGLKPPAPGAPPGRSAAPVERATARKRAAKGGRAGTGRRESTPVRAASRQRNSGRRT